MAKGKGQTKREKKYKQLLKIYDLLGKFNQIIVVSLENVGSLQVQQIRKQLQQTDSTLVVGKNTIIKKAVQLRKAKLEGDEFADFIKLGGPIPELKEFEPLVKLKVGFIFSKQPIFVIKALVEANKVTAPARVGVPAQRDVFVPPGPTSMDPSQISFFHALQISTKIQKGQIEITKEYRVCTEGKKVGNSEVALLQKMGIQPFFYAMHVLRAYDDGAVLSKEVCQLNPQDIINRFQVGIKNCTALSLETGIPTELSVPHAITNSFMNLAAIGLDIDYKFAQIANCSSGPAQQQAQQKGGKQESVKVPEPEQEEPEEEEDMDMGGLFD